MAGPIRLFGMPYLDVESTAAVGPDVRRGADLWVSSTAFSETGLPRSIAELKADAAEMAESADSVGVFRQDYRSDPDATLDGWTLSEKVVPPGQKVCVLGLYSAARGGLEPPPVEAAETLRLLPGDTPKALELSTDRAGCLRFALVLFVLCQGALLWFAPSRRETSSTMTDWIPTESDLFRAAGEGDAERVRLILGKKTVGPSPQDTIGRTPAHVAANPATLQVLLDAGAPPGVEDEFGVTPLMLAASEGDVLKVRLLLERGVAVDAHTRQGVTALSLAEEPATRKLLEKAGAPAAGPWDGEGSPIPGNGEDQWKVVLAYVEAIEEEDEAAYRALLKGDPGAFPTTVAIKGITPGNLRFLTGHLATNGAVVTGMGQNVNGDVLMTAFLEKDGGSWKIRGVETTPLSHRRSPSLIPGAK